LACSYAGCFERDDEEGDSCCTRTASSYSSSYVVGPYAVGDPFFGAVDKVVGSLAGGSGFDVRYVRASYALSVLSKHTQGRNKPSGSVIPKQNLIVPSATPGRCFAF